MNIFVAKLNPMTLSNDVQRIFEAYGVVDAADVIRDQYSTRSKCFCFVEMSNDEEANKAISALHNSYLDGYKIVVKEVDPREFRSKGGFIRDINFNDRDQVIL